MANKETSKTISQLGFGVCLLAALLVSWHFHNRFWYGPDDGYFGYIAQHILDGEILHKDIPVLHSGLNYLVNAFFLNVAGGDLVGLRYPLIVLTVVQTGFAYKLAEKHGPFIAIAAAIIAFSYSFVQFVNPTPNWYTLCFAIIIMYLLSQKDTTQTKTIVLAGFLVGVVFLLRQLTGVILAGAVTAVILLKNSNLETESKLNAGKIILSVLTLILGLYVFKVAKLTGLLTVGIHPLIVLVICARNCALGWKRALQIIGLLLGGAVVSAIPLALYYGTNGALFSWLHGMLISPFNFIDQSIFQKPNFFIVPAFALKELLAGNLAGIGGLIFWLSLIFAPMALGILVMRRLWNDRTDVPTIGIIGSIYSLVAIHYEIHTYILFCIAIVLLALLLSIRTLKRQRLWAALMIASSVTALCFHAGQSILRGFEGISTNARFENPSATVPHTSIIVPEMEAKKYRDILNVIENCSTKTDTIFVLPMNPEIHFLSRRESPFNFFVSVIGLSTKADLDNSLQTLEGSEAPALIIHDENDASNSAIALELLEKAKPHYIKLAEVADWVVYQHLDTNGPSPCYLANND